MKSPFLVEDEEQLWLTFLAISDASEKLRKNLLECANDDMKQIILGHLDSFGSLQTNILSHLKDHAEDKIIHDLAESINKELIELAEAIEEEENRLYSEDYSPEGSAR